MHYLYCTDDEFKSSREKHLLLLTKQLHAINTYPGITTAISKILRAGYNLQWVQEIENTEGKDSLLSQAIQQQLLLGIHSLPLGYITTLWDKSQNEWTSISHSNGYRGDWAKDVITTLHTYTYSIWKERNNILHQHAKKSARALTKQTLQDRIASLYKRGRANLTTYELQYFKLPAEQRQKKE